MEEGRLGELGGTQTVVQVSHTVRLILINLQCQCFIDDFVNIRPEDEKQVTTKPQHGKRGQGEDQQSD